MPASRLWPSLPAQIRRRGSQLLAYVGIVSPKQDRPSKKRLPPLRANVGPPQGPSITRRLSSSCLDTPLPRRELLQHTARHYATINAVQAGRGCRHNCRYCSVTVFHGQRYRRRPVADVIAELRALPRDFIFVDDNIIADREYALELFRALTPLPGTPLYAELAQAGRVTDPDWSHYDYRHVVFRPARMTATELQAGADWVYAQFYRLGRILCRCARTVFSVGWKPALLALKLGLTYRYDNLREGIVGWNPAPPERAPRSTLRPIRRPSLVPGRTG